MATIIPFPKSNTHPEFVKNEQERIENIKKYQMELALNTSIQMTYMILEEVLARGIELNENDGSLDQHLLMVSESVKSLMLKACDIRHPLQKITEQIVNKEEGQMFGQRWREEVFGSDSD